MRISNYELFGSLNYKKSQVSRICKNAGLSHTCCFSLDDLNDLYTSLLKYENLRNSSKLLLDKVELKIDSLQAGSLGK